jgi:periplasmic protein CpxP/Spy
MRTSTALLCAAAVILPVGAVTAFHSGLPVPLALAQSSSSPSIDPQVQPPTDPMAPGADPRTPDAKGKRGGEKRWLQQLNLTPEQQTRIQAIRDQEKTASESLRQNMRTARNEMRTLMATASAEQLRQQHKEVQGIHQQLDNQRFETMLKIREVLTPEQRVKMAELKPSGRGRRGGWQGGPGGGGPGGGPGAYQGEPGA